MLASIERLIDWLRFSERWIDQRGTSIDCLIDCVTGLQEKLPVVEYGQTQPSVAS